MSGTRPGSTISLETWRSRVKDWHQATQEPSLTALLIIESVILFLVVPLSAMDTLSVWILPAMFIVLVLTILVATWHSPIAAVVVIIAVILSPVGTLLWREHPSPLTEWLSSGGRLLAISALSFVIARTVFGPGRITMHRVQGAVVLYLNFALMFATIYRLLDVLTTGAFANLPHSGGEYGSGAALIYFSFSTLTTVGYGDITPVHPLARSIANLESVIGQLYPATLLARLVSLEIAHRGQP